VGRQTNEQTEAKTLFHSHGDSIFFSFPQIV